MRFCWDVQAGDVRAIRAAQQSFAEVLWRITEDASDVDGAAVVLGAVLEHVGESGLPRLCAVLRSSGERLSLEVGGVDRTFAAAISATFDPVASSHTAAFLIAQFSEGTEVTPTADGGATLRVALRCRMRTHEPGASRAG